ncbi:MAG TPA: HAD family hydrolase [Solirubrobacteraceae bacterium]|nr:HAD family hydrolase [Solirubrobacteraceae bacterium]
MAPRAILLDALGTLLAIEPPAPRLVTLLRERHGIDVGAGEAERALRIEMSHYRRQCSRAVDAGSLAALRLECAAILGREFGGAVAELPAADLVPTLLDSLHFAPFPEVPAALERWRAAGARLVVASNWDISLHGVLRETGLSELLDGVATSAEVGASKPAGELFAAALALAGVGAREAIHVGDSFSEDVEGARAAGIGAVWLRRDGQQGPADGETPAGVRVIATLDAL